MIDLSSIIIAISLIIGCTGLYVSVWSIFQVKELACITAEIVKNVKMTSIPINRYEGRQVDYNVGGKPLSSDNRRQIKRELADITAERM